MNKFNEPSGDEPNETPREWNIQPPADQFNSRIYPFKINPVVSAIIRRLNYHAIDNDYVKVPTSDFPVESNSESVPYTDTTTH